MDDLIDLLVIGGGAAGIVGAKTASRLGARTVLVEQHRTGGERDSPVVKTAISALAALVRRRRRGPGAQPSAR